jgi:hypothetical protein
LTRPETSTAQAIANSWIAPHATEPTFYRSVSVTN